MPTIFLRIAWMKEYKGVTKNDIPTGAGTHVQIHKDGGEVCNFLPIGTKYLGYARIQKGRNLRIERLGADKNATSINNVTVVFFAKNPDTGGQYIVGWYKHAVLHKSTRMLTKNLRKDHYNYLAEAEIKNSRLIHIDERIFEIPEDGPGQSNAWYVEESHPKWLKEEVQKYLADPDSYLVRRSKKSLSSRPWQQDAEMKKRVELEAMNEVSRYFELRNHKVAYRQTENLGWDLEATLEKKTLLLEVKGLSGSFNTVELTSNEFLNSKKNKLHYRICVVSYALDQAKRQLDIFYYKHGKWLSNNGGVLSVEPVYSARFHNMKTKKYKGLL